MLTPGDGRARRGARGRRVLPRAAADARPVPDETAAAVRARQRGRRDRAQRTRRRARSSRAIAWPRSARSAASPRRPSHPSSSRSRSRPSSTSRRAPALILNYHTAYFALLLRGRLQEGETVLVHGAAGGVGTAAIQVAKGLGAKTIALVSSEAKRAVAEAAGADHDAAARRRLEGRGSASSPAAASTSCSTRSAAIASPTACARCARTAALVVVGFTGGSIPEVRVNRLLLRNTEVDRRRLGRLRDGQARAQPRDRRRRQPHGGRAASSRRSSASASRWSARPTR